MASASPSKMFPLKYSCEEIYERMDKGLCIFCEELDTPGHHDSKHKRVRIVMTECDEDQVFEDKEEAHQETVTNPNPSVETVTNPESLVETLKNSGPFIESLKRASVLQVPDSFFDVLLVHKLDSHVKEVEELSQESTNGNEKNVAHQVFDKMPPALTSKEKRRKSLKAWKFKFKISFKRSKLMDDIFSFVEETAWLNRDPKETIWDFVKKECKETMAACGEKTIDRLKLVDETSKPAVYDRPFQIRVWDSGGSSFERVDEESSGDDKSSEVIATETVVKLMHKALMDNKYSFVDESSGKDVKVLEAQQGFKTQVCSNFDVKAFGLENYGWEYKRQMLILTRPYVVDVLSLDDGVFMTAKRLLISPRGNQVWEPGGVLIERDKWKGLEKCYERGRLMRLMHWLSSMWWKETKFKEIDRLDVCGTGMWLVICSCEKIQKLLLCYHRLKVQEMQIFPEDKVSIISMCKGLVCDKEKKKLRNARVDGCVYVLDRVNSLGEEEFVGLNESSELRSSREYLLMNFGIFMSPQPCHDKRITRALLVGLVGSEERLSNRLSLANYVWKPGELFCVQDQWDWISEVHSSGGVLKITQRLRGMRLQGFINMDKKLHKALLDDVLRVMVCWSVHNRMCEVKRKIYISANQNSRNQELLITYRFLMIGKFSRSKRLNETCCFLLEVYFEKFVGCNAHENETQSTNQSHGMEGSKRDIQGLENGYKRIVLKLKLPLSSGANWEQLFKWVDIHFSDNQRQEGLLSFPWELMLANLKENHACGVDTRFLEPDRYEFIWWVSSTCEADHISSETFSVGAVHGFFTGSKLQTGDETQEKRLLFLNNHNKVDPTVKENWFYNEPMIRGVFHLQRPPELFDLPGNLDFITKVLVQWKEHPPDQLFSGFYRQVLMLSSLRTRMF